MEFDLPGKTAKNKAKPSKQTRRLNEHHFGTGANELTNRDEPVKQRKQARTPALISEMNIAPRIGLGRASRRHTCHLPTFRHTFALVLHSGHVLIASF